LVETQRGKKKQPFCTSSKSFKNLAAENTLSKKQGGNTEDNKRRPRVRVEKRGHFWKRTDHICAPKGRNRQ